MTDTSPHLRADIVIDQQLALRTATTRLATEFDGTYGAETIGAEFPKPWTDEVVRAAEVVITMGCGDACPVFPGTRYENWDLNDPTGLDLANVRPIRDEIERRVRRLLDDLTSPPPDNNHHRPDHLGRHRHSAPPSHHPVNRRYEPGRYGLLDRDSIPGHQPDPLGTEPRTEPCDPHCTKGPS
ncbi:hypothetical protein V6U90_14860 [Micromonospora sp. CPCC 206060]|uniref:hypothetical protein n=1 Tax=Micromonospora sp. CPCC 206060 TaxID=3122406 RepID=UPI002FF2ACC7